MSLKADLISTSSPDVSFGNDASSSRIADRELTGGIVAILPRGEAIRNFIYSGALDDVASQLPVSLLTVIPDDEYQQMIEGRFDSLHELKAATESLPVRVLREQLDVTHGRYLWSEAAKERWRIRDHEARTLPRKIRRTTKKLMAEALANRAGLELLMQLERRASRWFSNNANDLELLRRLKPALVFNSSHSHSPNAVQAVQAAQWLGIPTATFLFSWDNLTSQGRIVPLYDYYLAWNEDIRQQLLGIYPSIRPEQVFVTGTPQFDFHFRPELYWSREEFCARVGADPSRPIVLYSTGMDNHMPGEPLIIEDINRMLKEMTAFGSPQLLVRLYPKDRTPHRFDEVRQRNPDILFPEIPWNTNFYTPKFEDAPLLTNTLRHCEVGINVASTVSLELCMFDKPVINVGYNPPVDIHPKDYALYYSFDHYKPVVESGAVRVAWTEAEMKDLLVKTLTDPLADSDKRGRFIKRMFGDTLDGKVSQRIAATLINLANKNK